MIRDALAAGIGVVCAAGLLAVPPLVTGGAGPATAAAGPTRSPGLAPQPQGCPARGPIRPVDAAADRAPLERVAQTYADAWFAHDAATVARLSDPAFAPRAAALVRGPLLAPEPPWGTDRVFPLARSLLGHAVAAHCGLGMIGALWGADVHRLRTSLHARLLLVKRPGGWRVWAIA